MRYEVAIWSFGHVRMTCSVFLWLTIVSAAILSGCGGGAGPVQITFPGGATLVIDQGQSIAINATTTNDGGAGVTWTCSGAACTTLASATTTSVTFNATGAAGMATITATSVKDTKVSQAVTVTVTNAPTVTTTQAQLSGTAAVAGQSFAFTFAASGGAGTLTWSATGLSDGLSINANTGAIGGTPTSKGTVTFTVTVKDSSAAGAKSFTTASLTITVANPPAPAITTTQAQVTAAPGTAASAYSFTFHASGTGTLTWAATGLPADGLSLAASTGVVSGTPSSQQSINIMLTVSDTYGQSSAATPFTITVNNPPAPTITTTQSQVTAATVDTAYSFTFHASGGGTITWTSTGLPADGLSLNAATGAVSGTPTSKTTVALTLTAHDSFGQASAATAFNITVNNPAPPVINTTPALLPSATVNIAYSFTLQGSGAGTLSWSTTPALSDGLSLNAATGAISGTPTTATTLNFSVTLTDGIGQQTTVPGFSIVVSTESIAFTSTVPSRSVQSGSFSVAATVAGDPNNPAGGVDWTVTCGSTQCGSFTSTHTVSGAATTFTAPSAVPTGGTVTITATAHDAPSPKVSAVVIVNQTAQAGCADKPTGDESALNGHYAFLTQEWPGITPATVLFSADFDGHGHLADLGGGVTGEADVNDSGTGNVGTANLASTDQNAATLYTVGKDPSGSGDIACYALALAGTTFKTTYLISLGKKNGSGIYTSGRVIEFDPAAGEFNAGIMLLQTTPFGFGSGSQNLAFGANGFDTGFKASSEAGYLTLSSTGAISNLSADFSDAGNLNFGVAGPVLGKSGSNGSFSTPDSIAGRSTVIENYTVGSATVTLHYAAYQVNPSEYLFISTDLVASMDLDVIGRMVATGAPGSFSDSSLSGNFVVHETGIDSGKAGVLLGLYDFSAGTITGNDYEYEEGLTSVSGNARSGTYSVASASGRVTLAGAGLGNHPPILYLAAPTATTEPISAFVVGTDPSGSFGFAEASSGTFTTAGLAGNYFFAGEDPGDATVGYRVGVIAASSSGSLAGTFYENNPPNGESPAGLSESQNFGGAAFSFNADGRGTVGSNTVAITNGNRIFFFDEGDTVGEIPAKITTIEKQ